MREMFKDCSSLISLPDISKWDTNIVINMKKMFAGCSSLISLPDISNWNLNYCTNINEIFDDCSKLNTFPNMIKPKISDINEMIRIYRIYLSLSSLFLFQKLKKKYQN